MGVTCKNWCDLNQGGIHCDCGQEKVERVSQLDKEVETLRAYRDRLANALREVRVWTQAPSVRKIIDTALKQTKG